MKDDIFYLRDILERINRIENYTATGKEEFLKSLLIQDGVIRSFEVIGEAVKLIYQEIKQQYKQIPWRKIAGFRDVLIHDYMRVDLEEVWNVIESNLPILKEQILLIITEIYR